MTAATTALLIDAGNSSLKWAICHNGQLEIGDPVVYQWPQLEQQLTDAWQLFPKKNLSPTKIILANVAGQRVLDALNQWRDKVLNASLVVKETNGVTIEIVVAQANAYDVKNAYEYPETLGADRWVALVAARHYMPGDTCIINCGTALTIDILTADGEHAGGMIAPGWDMMKSSLVMNTNGIVSADGKVPELLGQTTQQSVQAGISAASIGAVEYIVQRYQKEMGRELTCVVTGGGASFLLPKLLASKSVGIFRHGPDWVLKGLAVISGNPVDNVLVDDSGVYS